MKLSRRWLRRYIDLPASSRDLDTILTNVGLELEGVEDDAARINGVIVGHVRSCRKHPNADKLSVCEVFDGTDMHTVVCGAPNVAEGQLIAFAPVGVHLPVVDLTIGRRTLRGVESAGMICSAAELGLSNDHSGIMVLDGTPAPGTPLAVALGLDDATYEIGITPNRGDALSHIGVGRDLAAGTSVELRMPEAPMLPDVAIPDFRVQNDAADLCPRYSCAGIRGVRIGPSPEWMQQDLEHAGIRPINILVDVTNYVMLEIGQPMHAFDRGQLRGKGIHIRRAEEGESFTTLDGRTHTLGASMLLICDMERPVAVAGVMGGENSEIRDETVDVLLESAHFDASSVRRTARLLGISTDSSYRFERGTDVNITVWALSRAVDLITQHAGGYCDGVIDTYPVPIPQRTITLRPTRTEQILGITLSAAQQADILTRLQFEVSVHAEEIRVSVPGFRNDIEREIDLIEEVARIHGYDNIPVPEKIQMHATRRADDDTFTGTLRGVFLSMGFDEVMTSSLVSEKAAAFRVPEGASPVRVLNPVSSERPSLRSSLLPSLLETVSYNGRLGTNDLRIFEIGAVFTEIETGETGSLNGYKEEVQCAALIAGVAQRREWHAAERSVDFHDMKGAIESLLDRLRLDNKVRFSYDAQSTSSDPTLGIEVESVSAGCIMQVPEEVLQMFDISVPVIYVELIVPALAAQVVQEHRYEPVSRFQAVHRDIAVLVDFSVPASGLVDAIRDAHLADLTDVRVIDVFMHESLGVNRKSVALSLVFQPTDRTLTEQEISDRMQRAHAALAVAWNAELRA